MKVCPFAASVSRAAVESAIGHQSERRLLIRRIRSVGDVLALFEEVSPQSTCWSMLMSRSSVADRLRPDGAKLSASSNPGEGVLNEALDAWKWLREEPILVVEDLYLERVPKADARSVLEAAKAPSAS